MIRLVRLSEPPVLVFDETYYAKDACLYANNPPSVCMLTQATEQTYVHPPLGKWIIALGIKVFGFNSFGWRISAVVFGVALVLVAYLIAGKLFRSRWAAGTAGLLVATDFLLFVQSRIAMLDIFLAFFVALGMLFMAMDRDRVLAVKEHLEGSDTGPVPKRGVAWRLAAGVALGLALAVKWSAVYALGLAGLLSIVWTIGLLRVRRRTGSGDDPEPKRAGLKAVAISCLALGLVPLVVYVGSYADWFARQSARECPYSVPGPERAFGAGFFDLTEGECVFGVTGVMLSFGDLHDRVADYHLNLKAEHPYQSKAWTWPLVLRPVAYHYEGPAGRSSEILGGANIVVWYAALLSTVWLAVRSLRRWRPERLVLAAWAVQYVPWLLVSRPLFFFYLTPAVPFMMIGLAGALDALRRRGAFARRLVFGFLVVGVGVMLVISFPILTAIEIDYDLWRRLMWIPQFKCGGLQCGWI